MTNKTKKNLLITAESHFVSPQQRHAEVYYTDNDITGADSTGVDGIGGETLVHLCAMLGATMHSSKISTSSEK